MGGVRERQEADDSRGGAGRIGHPKCNMYSDLLVWAVRSKIENGLSISNASRDYGICRWTLSNWRDFKARKHSIYTEGVNA